MSAALPIMRAARLCRALSLAATVTGCCSGGASECEGVGLLWAYAAAPIAAPVLLPMRLANGVLAPTPAPPERYGIVARESIPVDAVCGVGWSAAGDLVVLRNTGSGKAAASTLALDGREQPIPDAPTDRFVGVRGRDSVGIPGTTLVASTRRAPEQGGVVWRAVIRDIATDARPLDQAMPLDLALGDIVVSRNGRLVAFLGMHQFWLFRVERGTVSQLAVRGAGSGHGIVGAAFDPTETMFAVAGRDEVAVFTIKLPPVAAR